MWMRFSHLGLTAAHHTVEIEEVVAHAVASACCCKLRQRPSMRWMIAVLTAALLLHSVVGQKQRASTTKFGGAWFTFTLRCLDVERETFNHLRVLRDGLNCRYHARSSNHRQAEAFLKFFFPSIKRANVRITVGSHPPYLRKAPCLVH